MSNTHVKSDIATNRDRGNISDIATNPNRGNIPRTISQTFSDGGNISADSATLSMIALTAAWTLA